MKSAFTGIWSYRSLLNNPDLTVEFSDLRFGLADLVLKEPAPGTVTGTIGGDGWSLVLNGWQANGSPNTVRFQGVGDIGGEKWIYDYLGYLSPHWLNGVDQVPAIVGTIVRSAPHSAGEARAGLVASWYAVKRS